MFKLQNYLLLKKYILLIIEFKPVPSNTYKNAAEVNPIILLHNIFRKGYLSLHSRLIFIIKFGINFYIFLDFGPIFDGTVGQSCQMFKIPLIEIT